MRKLRGSAGGGVRAEVGGGGLDAGPCSFPPRIQAPGAPDAAGDAALSPRELAHGVLALAALDVGVGVVPRAAIRAAQLHLPLAGALLLAAGAPVVQGLGLG